MPRGIGVRAMIPANFMVMYLGQLRATWRRTFGVILGVALISAVVASSILGWPAFPQQVGYQLIVSSCVGLLFWLGRPFIRSSGDRFGPSARWGVRILS